MLSFEEAYEQRQYIVSVQQKGLKDSSPGKVYRASQCEASEIPTMPDHCGHFVSHVGLLNQKRA